MLKGFLYATKMPVQILSDFVFRLLFRLQRLS